MRRQLPIKKRRVPRVLIVKAGASEAIIRKRTVGRSKLSRQAEEKLSQLKSSDDAKRYLAVRELAGLKERVAAPFVARVLQEDYSAGVRMGAAIALGELGNNSREVIGLLQKAWINEKSEPVKVAIHNALKKLGA